MTPGTRLTVFGGIAAACIFSALSVGRGGEAAPGWQMEWEKTLAAAKKEGKVVLAIPPSAELRAQMEVEFKKRFGLEIELVPAPGPRNAARIVSEYKAGVRYFDGLIVGTGTAESLAQDGILEPLEPFMILPEVREPRNWWAGHIWEDNIKTNRFLYSFIADVGTSGLWYNTDLCKPEELQSLDDFLNPKWKGKIGFSDPRIPGSGQSFWAFMWEVKGEGYLRKIVQQELFLSRDLRQIADALAKSKLAIGIGIGYAQVEPFAKSGLPVKKVPPPKEGMPASNGFGVIGIVRNQPHPNGIKVFLNWFLGREGQGFYSRVMKMGTRRLDVETRWLAEEGIQAAKDFITVEEYHRLRNHLEDKFMKVRLPAGQFAELLLK